MVPSRKVWHGIYNDLHPGKRWPSVTMSLLLIFTLVVISHLNTNNSRRSAYLTNNISEEKKLTGELKKGGGPKTNRRIVVRKTDLVKGREIFAYSAGGANSTKLATGTALKNYQNNNLTEERLLSDNLKAQDNPVPSFIERNLAFDPQANTTASENNIAEKRNNIEPRQQNSSGLPGLMKPALEPIIVAKAVGNPSNKKVVTGTIDNPGTETVSQDKNSRELSANKVSKTQVKVAILRKKRNDKINWVYFASPLVSSVAFSGKPLKQSPAVNFSPGLVASQKNTVLHNSALGLEAGAQMNYRIAKKLQFTAGAHLTYSGYNILSNEVHPTFATLVLRDRATGAAYSRSFITHYGDGTGQAVVTIRNYNWQASIPFGLQYQIGGNTKVQFNAGGNLEPSLVLKSNAYILSSDGNNYINDPSLLRKWNISSNFGAFVSFRSSKLKWQVGPSVRYQWLSTYKKEYTIKEHLIDYGIRIGISK
jgi:hypothetical protein